MPISTVKEILFFPLNLLIHSTNLYGVICMCLRWMLSQIFDFWSANLSWFVHFLFLWIIYFPDMYSGNLVMMFLHISARLNTFIVFLSFQSLSLLPGLLIPHSSPFVRVTWSITWLHIGNQPILLMWGKFSKYSFCVCAFPCSLHPSMDPPYQRAKHIIAFN